MEKVWVLWCSHFSGVQVYVGQAGPSALCPTRLVVPFENQRHGALGAARLVCGTLVWLLGDSSGAEPFTSKVPPTWHRLRLARGTTCWASLFGSVAALPPVVHATLFPLAWLHW